MSGRINLLRLACQKCMFRRTQKRKTEQIFIGLHQPDLENFGAAASLKHEKPFSFRFLKYSTSGKGSIDDTVDQLDRTAYKLLYVAYKLEHDDKLKLSALYMQATEGKCNERKPLNTAKDYEIEYWNSWNSLGDMSKEEAAKQYLEIASKYVKQNS